MVCRVGIGTLAVAAMLLIGAPSGATDDAASRGS
jgi:hypothetical protein